MKIWTGDNLFDTFTSTKIDLTECENKVQDPIVIGFAKVDILNRTVVWLPFDRFFGQCRGHKILVENRAD